MIPVSLAELTALLDGQLLGSAGQLRGPAEQSGDRTREQADGSGLVTDLAVDSRAAGPGTLFVALPGARVDGHDFVAAAIGRGAVAALVARPVSGVAAPCLVVADPLAAMGRIARDQVDRARGGGLVVVGVTGSAGKTSTKDLLGQVLAAAGATIAPAGNLNNEIGLPLTVARIDRGTRFLVAEMGARGVGHIRYLCTVSPPTVGVVLNVGSAHVGEFGGRAEIARAKGELVEALPVEGTAVLNADDPLVSGMRDRTAARVLTFSTRGDPGGADAVWASGLAADAHGRYRFALHARLEGSTRAEVEVQLAVTGRHQVGNALATAGAAAALGLSSARIAAALAAAGARSRWRMELTTRADGALVVNDAYNANPESMAAALDATAELVAGRPGGQAWAVLGDMLELGDTAVEAHVELGRLAVARGVDHLLAVGSYAEHIAAGARTASAAADVRTVEKARLAEIVNEGLRPADVVLVKASRGLALETVAAQLQSAGAPGPGRRSSEDSA